MKKRMIWCLLASLIVVSVLVAGCSKGGSTAGSPAAPTNSQGAVGAGGQWPSQMPPDVPKFTYGTITGFGSTSGSVEVGINNATPDSFEKYQSDLKNAGWTILETSQISGYGIAAAKGKRGVNVSFGLNSSNELSGQVIYIANKNGS